MAMHKITIAREAIRQLTMLGEMLAEDHWNGGAVNFHANSANHYIHAIQVAKLAVPEFRCGRSFLRAHGWNV